MEMKTIIRQPERKSLQEYIAAKGQWETREEVRGRQGSEGLRSGSPPDPRRSRCLLPVPNFQAWEPGGASCRAGGAVARLPPHAGVEGIP